MHIIYMYVYVKPNRLIFLRAKKHRECVEIFGYFYWGLGWASCTL